MTGPWRPARRYEWSAPAEVDPHDPTHGATGCDCLFHRRVFAHINLKPGLETSVRERGGWDRWILPLARTVERIYYHDGRIRWTMTIKLDGALIEVERFVRPGGLPTFDALAGDPRGIRTGVDPGRRSTAIVSAGGGVRLERYGKNAAIDLAARYARGGGDPTLIYLLPAGLATPDPAHLVIWTDAWWWRVMESLLDGSKCDPLVDDPLVDDPGCGREFTEETG